MNSKLYFKYSFVTLLAISTTDVIHSPPQLQKHKFRISTMQPNLPSQLTVSLLEAY